MFSKYILYGLTAITFMAGMAMAAYTLVISGQPTADVVAKTNETYVTISVSDFEPGTAEIVRIGHHPPIIVWRRSEEEIQLALEQDDPSSWPSYMSKITGASPVEAYDANLTIDHEWFIAWAQVPGGFGCTLIAKTGEHDGLFDPCHSSHFDLAGRVRRGPNQENLTVINAKISDDGDQIEMYLGEPLTFRRYNF